MIQYSAVIVAAGEGRRLGLGYNKAYYRFKDGKTILEHAMHPFLEDSDCRQLIIVTDPQQYSECIFLTDARISIVGGGSSRQESVRAGLELVDQDIVMIHDGARPFLSMENLTAVKKTMESEQAACLTVPCKDTIKLVEDGYIVKTIPRQSLAAAQTPQAFSVSLIRECMRKAEADGFAATDDCSLVEAYSTVRIASVAGSYENYKVTTPEDLNKTEFQ